MNGKREKMKLYLVSDIHYNHANIIMYCNRPFKCKEHMNDTLLDNWNRVVKPEDYVINLGDVSANIRTDNDILKFNDWLGELNGNKILIKGNHDHFSKEFYLKTHIQVKDYLIIGEYFLVHYPCYTNSKYTKPVDKRMLKIFKESGCKYIIHGHTHNNQSNNIKTEWDDGIVRFNTSIEVLQYSPMLFQDVVNS